MTSLLAWIWLPAVLLAVGTGLGLLCEAITRVRLPGAIVAAVGMCAGILIVTVAYELHATSAVVTPLLVVLALVGVVLRRDGLAARLRPGPAGLAALGAYGLYLAPVVLSGSWTWEGYNYTNDPANTLTTTWWILGHGATVPPAGVSTTLNVAGSLVDQGYPIAPHLFMGSIAPLAGIGLVAAYQPFIAFVAALAAAAFTQIARAAGVRPWAAAAVGLFATGANLMYVYGSLGGLKELMTVAALATATAIACQVPARDWTYGLVAVFVVALAAIVPTLSTGGIAYAGLLAIVPFSLAVVAHAREPRERRRRLLRVLGQAAFGAVCFLALTAFTLADARALRVDRRDRAQRDPARPAPAPAAARPDRRHLVGRRLAAARRRGRDVDAQPRPARARLRRRRARRRPAPAPPPRARARRSVRGRRGDRGHRPADVAVRRVEAARDRDPVRAADGGHRARTARRAPAGRGPRRRRGDRRRGPLHGRDRLPHRPPRADRAHGGDAGHGGGVARHGPRPAPRQRRVVEVLLSRQPRPEPGRDLVGREAVGPALGLRPGQPVLRPRHAQAELRVGLPGDRHTQLARRQPPAGELPPGAPQRLLPAVGARPADDGRQPHAAAGRVQRAGRAALRGRPALRPAPGAPGRRARRRPLGHERRDDAAGQRPGRELAPLTRAARRDRPVRAGARRDGARDGRRALPRLAAGQQRPPGVRADRRAPDRRDAAGEHHGAVDRRRRGDAAHGPSPARDRPSRRVARAR